MSSSSRLAQGRDVATVIVDGRIVVENGRAVLVDPERVRQEGRAAAESLWTRVTGQVPGSLRHRGHQEAIQ